MSAPEAIIRSDYRHWNERRSRLSDFSVNQELIVTRDFFARLESLRGLAALAVAGYHILGTPWQTANGSGILISGAPAYENSAWTAALKVLKAMFNGNSAVIEFFVLSGFVLFFSLLRNANKPPTGFTAFCVARIFRIYPATIATIVFFVGVYWMIDPTLCKHCFGARTILANAMLLETSIDGVMWSLQVELLAVPVILAAFYGWHRWGPVPLIALFFIFAALSFAGPFYRAIGPGLPFHAFIAGMIAAVYGKQLIGGLSPTASRATFAITVAMFFLARPVIGFTSHWSVQVEIIAGAVLIALLAFGQLGRIGALFDAKPVRTLGRLSFSFYLLHPIVMPFLATASAATTVGALISVGLPTPLVIIVLIAVSVAVTFPFAWLMYYLVEQPGIKAGRSVIQRLASARRSPIGQTS